MSYISKTAKTSATAAIALLLVSACAVGPDFLRPDAPNVKGYTHDALPVQTSASDTPGGAAQKFVDNKDVPAQWWTLYNSPALNQLVDQALKANPDLQAAQASLRQAQETAYAQEGSFFPAVDLTPSITREKISPASFGEPKFPSSIFTLYDASVSVSYTLDIFGGTRRLVESAQAQADYQRYQFEAAYLTLTTNVVTAAIQQASLLEQVKQTQDIIAIDQKQLDVLQQQLKLGGVARTAVLQQQATLAQLQATLPPLQKQLSQNRHQLAVLTGQLPSDATFAQFDLTTLSLPQDLPVLLPSKLVEQRPDIKAAEAQLHAASADIGVATANMLPQVTLSGSYGGEATSSSKVFTGSSNVWSFGADLVQPIFHGGTLLHQRRAAVAAYDKAFAQYRSTVLTAFGNVADTLRALQFDADALGAQANAESAASDTLSLAQTQFKEGAISYPQLLDAEHTFAQARISLVQARAARFADTAALFQSLGGDWKSKPDVIADIPASATAATPAAVKPIPVVAPAATPKTPTPIGAIPVTPPAAPTPQPSAIPPATNEKKP